MYVAKNALADKVHKQGAIPHVLHFHITHATPLEIYRNPVQKLFLDNVLNLQKTQFIGVTVTDVQPLYMMKHSILPVSLGTNLAGKKCSVWKQ